MSLLKKKLSLIVGLTLLSCISLLTFSFSYNALAKQKTVVSFTELNALSDNNVIIVHEYNGSRFAMSINDDQVAPKCIDDYFQNGSFDFSKTDISDISNILWSVSYDGENGFLITSSCGDYRYLIYDKNTGVTLTDDDPSGVYNNYLYSGVLPLRFSVSPIYVCFNGTTYFNGSNTDNVAHVYARSESVLNAYTLTFSYEGTISTSEVLQNQTFVLPDCSYEKSGYSFAFWQLDGDQTKYRAGDSITPTSDLSFTAVFVKNVTATFKNFDNSVFATVLSTDETTLFPEITNENLLILGWLDENGNLYKIGSPITDLVEDVSFSPLAVDYSLTDGAYVYAGGQDGINTSGLRFESVLLPTENVDLSTYIATYGIILAPEDYLGIYGDELNFADFTSGETMLVFEQELPVALGEKITFHATMIDLFPHNYAREFCVRGFLKVCFSDGTFDYVYTVYDEEKNCRSVYSICLKIKADDYLGLTDEQIAIIDAYISSVENG